LKKLEFNESVKIVPQKHVLLDLASLYLEILFPWRLVGSISRAYAKSAQSK